MNAFGDVTGDCTTLDLDDGDTLKTINIGYTGSEVTSLSLITS